jgi:hypothetical protein
MTELKHEIRGELSSLAGQFSEELRAQTHEAIRAAEMQEDAALGERITRVTGELMEALSDRLRDAARTGERTYSMCYMYVEGYNTAEFGRFHQPHEVAAQFGEAMCAAVRALDPGLDVDCQVFSWGLSSAYPEVRIRW